MSERKTPFQDFYMRHVALVRRVVAKTCPEEEVDDVAAATWARLQPKWPFTHIENIDAYLTTAAKHEVAMYLRERDAKKRPRSRRRVAFPEDDPSNVTVDHALTKSLDIAGTLDRDRLRNNLRVLSDELTGDNGDILRRFLDDPSSVSGPELGRCTASARRKIKAVGRDVDPLKEGPSFLGHVVERIRKAKKDQD